MAQWSTAQARAGVGHAPAVRSLLQRSEAELVAAQLAGEPSERFVHAYLAALRAGAAVLAALEPAPRRGGPRSVWEMVSRVVPDLAPACAYFAAGAGLRAALESGREQDVAEERAEATVAAAEDFADAVLGVLAERGSGAAATNRPLAMGVA